MSRQTERDLTLVIRNRIAEWWHDLETGKKIAVSWLGILALGLIVLTVLYPMVMLSIFGIILCLGAFIGTIFALVVLTD